jgi:hypothetical protein
MATSLDLARTYTSYSGVDIRVIINGAQVGSMQALSYAIQREKAPIYVMGSVDPISYSRGKRGIAGTMISLMMDTHILMSPSFTGEYYLGDTDEIFAEFTAGKGGSSPTVPLTSAETDAAFNNLDNEVDSAVELTTAALSGFGGRIPTGSSLGFFSGAPGTEGATGSGAYNRMSTYPYELSEIGNNYRVSPVFYVDQILPFDIAIVAANEYGQSAQMRLYGCEILNEGSGFSIDDIVIENQMTYVCRTILPWRSFNLNASNPEGEMVKARDELYKRVGSVKNRGGAIKDPAPVSYNV